MTLDDAVRVTVTEAVAPLVREIKALRERLDRTLPSAFGTRRDAARVMGCSLSLVDRMIARGELVPKRAGRRVLIDLSALRPPTEEEVDEAVRGARRAR